jgi:hypothetical protein
MHKINPKYPAIGKSAEQLPAVKQKEKNDGF